MERNKIGKLMGLVGAHCVRNAHPTRTRPLSDGIFLCLRKWPAAAPIVGVSDGSGARRGSSLGTGR